MVKQQQDATTSTAPTPLDRASVETFMRSFGAFVERAYELSDPKVDTAGSRLRAHLGQKAATFPIVSESFGTWDHINVQRALTIMGRSRLKVAWNGLVGDHRYSDLNLSALIVNEARWSNDRIGPIVYRNQQSGVDSHEACISIGFAIGTYKGQQIALLLRLGEPNGPTGAMLRLEIAASDRDLSETLLNDLRSTMQEHNVYRRQMLSFSVCDDGSLQINFLRRETVKRTDIVLPKGILEAVEQHVIGIATHRKKLRSMGQHLKRGVLLHGAPGAGKTLTVRYLASHMQESTVIVLTGAALRAISPSCVMARALAPALVVIEDVDLIAHERHQVGMETNPLLFSLLNEMDGIDGDSDVAFLLTTNRPEVLEPALAERPGRIDLAVEVPLPNAQSRRLLLRRYGKALGLLFSDPKDIVDRTDGVSASFIRELLRKATMNALTANQKVSERHVSGALDELLESKAGLTRSLLGSPRNV
jgi:cell division protease FtsH